MSKPTKNTKQPGTKLLLPLCVAGVLVLAALLTCLTQRAPSNVAVYQKKLSLLAPSVLAAETGKSPAGGQAGQAVFLSLCDTTERASVFCGTGPDLPAAWEAASEMAKDFLANSNYDPVWVKADVVSSSDTLQSSELSRAVLAARHEFYRYGVAFDQMFETALLEAEMNGAKIYDYDNGGINLDYLNRYLKQAGRSPLDALPEVFTIFQCQGWFCDENNAVYPLNSSGLDYGRRAESVDASRARELILNASAFLEAQIQEDGSFIYGIYPRFDNEIENYNIVRHASTLWSLICRYRLAPDQALAEKIEATIGFMLDSVIYDQEGRAFLYEEKDDEIKLGGCGVAVVALTEYMDVFQNDNYQDVCRALGQGILSMLDQSTGEYYHVLNGGFSRKEALRTVYYDGEATFALCRLYSLTGERIWLEAAKSAVAHFIEADYTQYKDHWVAYSMNEITKHISDNEAYYAFALANAQNNLDAIRERDTTYHTYLEMLMATFEVYDRMLQNGFQPADFDLQAFLETISTRVNRQLNGYFYPEYAMYMKNPQRILNTFMVRHDGYRIRIDDVQHNIGGFYLYFKNYDKLVACGLPVSGD
ncbi:MAG: glycosyl hydrolase family 88 [Oscillospiraceae bacterium]|nr:glycosyl hydrolase family 88 [Oscillospiraceae bacterium]